MTFPSYPAYKDSGVPWIGEVPVTWEVKPFKWLLDNNDGGVWGDDPTGEDDTLVLRSTDQTVDGNWKLTDPAPRKLSAKEKASALLVEGDLVVTKSSGSSLHIGKTTLVTADIAKQGCCYGNFMQRLRVNSSFTPKLAWYVMNNELARAQLDLLSNSTTGLANLNGTLIGEILLPVSTVAEQTQIARFLDHETARIDALIEEQQRLIELLKEKRQAVISHAVTKGLDPTVPMKDSGVEWLGEVPAHWVVSRAKLVSDIFVPQRNKPELNDSEGIPWVTMEDMNGGYITATNLKVTELAAREAGSKVLKKGAVIASCVGRFGIVAINAVDVVINQQLQAFEPRKIKAEYLRSIVSLSKEYFELIGTAATLVYVNQQGFENLPVLVPSAGEQESICLYVDEANARFDALLSQSLESIELLQERRSALISAAVTGKIDVRGWQPPASTQAPESAVAEAN